MTAGKLLKAFRERAGYSQETMAALLHRTQSCISKIEQDKRVLDVDTFIKWTRFTNCTEAGIAFLYGVDPAQILHAVMQFTGVAFGLVLYQMVGG